MRMIQIKREPSLKTVFFLDEVDMSSLNKVRLFSAESPFLALTAFCKKEVILSEVFSDEDKRQFIKEIEAHEEKHRTQGSSILPGHCNGIFSRYGLDIRATKEDAAGWEKASFLVDSLTFPMDNVVESSKGSKYGAVARIVIYGNQGIGVQMQNLSPNGALHGLSETFIESCGHAKRPGDNQDPGISVSLYLLDENSPHGSASSEYGLAEIPVGAISFDPEMGLGSMASMMMNNEEWGYQTLQGNGTKSQYVSAEENSRLSGSAESMLVKNALPGGGHWILYRPETEGDFFSFKQEESLNVITLKAEDIKEARANLAAGGFKTDGFESVETPFKENILQIRDALQVLSGGKLAGREGGEKPDMKTFLDHNRDLPRALCAALKSYIPGSALNKDETLRVIAAENMTFEQANNESDSPSSS